MEHKQEQWGSRLGFIFAAVGSAVGLGNIWRFPTIVGQNGGGAFVLIFLVMMFLVGIPVLMMEISLGKKAQRNVVGTFKELRPGTRWPMVGVLASAAAFIILSFYSVIAGWSMAYVVKFIQGEFMQVSPEGVAQVFGDLASHPIIPVLWHGLFMAMAIGIVVLGIKKGIERWSKILMPILFLLLLVLAVRSLTLEGAGEGVAWLLRPDFSNVNFNTILIALGQVFFSLSLGMGIMVTYGSYLGPRENIPMSATIIGLADMGVALLAGLVIIPAVFAFGLDPETGPALIFITLPAVFQSIPLGSLFGLLFFVLITVAALTSAMSLLEVVVAHWVGELKWSRRKATILAGLGVFALGVPSSLSNGVLEDFTVAGLPFLDLMDAFTANVMLPLGGLLTVIFAGWVWGRKNSLAAVEGEAGSFALGEVWTFLVRWLLPLALAYILISGLWPG